MLRVSPTCLRFIACAGAAVALLLHPTAAVAADEEPCFSTAGCDQVPEPVTSPGAEDGTISMFIETNGFQTGGTPYQRTATVRIAPRCWYKWWATGKDYADMWSDPDYLRGIGATDDPYKTTPFDGYLEHKDKGADEGAWYWPWCNEAVDGAYVLQYVDSHPPRYFPRNDPPRVDTADVDPLLMVQRAYEEMDLPTGTVRWNPSLEGSGATVVNFETWVWVEEAAQTATVRATLETGQWAQVEARVTGVVVSAPGAQDAECDDLGVPWSPEQESTGGQCVIVFDRSSAREERKGGRTHRTTTMEVVASWSATWTSWQNPEPQEFATPTTTVTAEIPVAEVQTVVTG